MEKSRPFVILSAAMTLDGKIGKKHTNIKLSSKRDKIRVHKLRAKVDGILIGKNTLDFDNPMLSVRYARGKNPLRIVLDSRGTIKSASKIVKSCREIPTIVVTTNLISKKNLHRLEKFPLEIIKCGESAVNLKRLMQILYKKGIKKIKNIDLEVRELISTMQIIFQTCSEFDGKVFWQNRFLKKSFLKVLPNQNFLIFCSILVTKIEQKTEKFG